MYVHNHTHTQLANHIKLLFSQQCIKQLSYTFIGVHVHVRKNVGFDHNVSQWRS